VQRRVFALYGALKLLEDELAARGRAFQTGGRFSEPRPSSTDEQSIQRNIFSDFELGPTEAKLPILLVRPSIASGLKCSPALPLLGNDLPVAGLADTHVDNEVIDGLQ
jgi:hypothetical protein